MLVHTVEKYSIILWHLVCLGPLWETFGFLSRTIHVEQRKMAALRTANLIWFGTPDCLPPCWTRAAHFSAASGLSFTGGTVNGSFADTLLPPPPLSLTHASIPTTHIHMCVRARSSAVLHAHAHTDTRTVANIPHTLSCIQGGHVTALPFFSLLRHSPSRKFWMQDWQPLRWMALSIKRKILFLWFVVQIKLKRKKKDLSWFLEDRILFRLQTFRSPLSLKIKKQTNGWFPVPWKHFL